MSLGILGEESESCEADGHSRRGNQHEELSSADVAEQGCDIGAQDLNCSDDNAAGVGVHGAVRLGEYVRHVVDHGEEPTELIGDEQNQGGAICLQSGSGAFKKLDTYI